MAKALAAGLSRRQALRRFGGGLAGAFLASLGLAQAQGAPKRSESDGPKNCADYRKNYVGVAPGHGDAYGKCVSNCRPCINGGGTACGADNCRTDGEPCSSDPDGTCESPCLANSSACTKSSDCCINSCFLGVCQEGPA
jgi:hypothetical protein